MSAIDMSFGELGAVYLLLLIPLGIFSAFRMRLLGRTGWALVRMTGQLLLAGLYLTYLLEWNSLPLNLAWVLVMLVAANLNILGNAGVSVRRFLPVTLAATGFATLAVTGWFLGFAVQPEPLYDARYLVPITGMLLGNCLRSNIVCLERFFSSVQENQKEFLTYLYLGASLKEACFPHMRKALQASLLPTVSTMATMGIVSLPGMMTGQILAGGNPLIAIKYQLAIMVAILAASSLGAYLNLWAGLRIAFDDYQRLRPEVLR